MIHDLHLAYFWRHFVCLPRGTQVVNLILENKKIWAITTLLLLLCKSPVQQLVCTSTLLKQLTTSVRPIWSMPMLGWCYTLFSYTYPTRSPDGTLPGFPPPLVSQAQAKNFAKCYSNRADACSLFLVCCLTLIGQKADKLSHAVLTVTCQNDLLKLTQQPSCLFCREAMKKGLKWYEQENSCTAEGAAMDPLPLQQLQFTWVRPADALSFGQIFSTFFSILPNQTQTCCSSVFKRVATFALEGKITSFMMQVSE